MSSKKVCTEILKLGDAAKRATKEEIKKSNLPVLQTIGLVQMMKLAQL